MALASPAGRSFAAALAPLLATTGDHIPEDERHYFEPVRLPVAQARLRRQREVRLIAWRRAEAKRRGVDEQVVLPGHCLKDAVESDVETVEDLARVPGLGAFRLRQDGEAIVQAMRGEEEPA